MEGREVPHEQVLNPVRVLVLVHEHVPEAARVAVADSVMGVEDLEDLEEQVVEVERVLLAHALLVALRDLDVDVLLHAARAEAVPTGLALAAAVLLGADPAADDGRAELLGVVTQLLDDLLDEAVAVRRVVDREVPGVPVEDLDLAPQDPGAHRVERTDPGAARAAGGGSGLGRPARDEALNALAHLARGLVGEGDRQDLPGRHPPRRDEVRDARRDDPRLAGSRARDDEQRPVAVQHGFPLGIVEALEQRLRLDPVVPSARAGAHGLLQIEPVHRRVSLRRASGFGTRHEPSRRQLGSTTISRHSQRASMACRGPSRPIPESLMPP